MDKFGDSTEIALLVNLIIKIAKGLFTNYIYKKRWVGSPKMSTFRQRS